MSFLEKLFRKPYADELRRATALVPRINSFEDTLKKLGDAELAQKTPEFLKRLEENNDLNLLLPEAYAVVREVARRTLGQRHYDAQMVGGILLHSGKITEMRTGEGKTLVGTLPAYLNALTKRGVHIVTVNDYLARRDATWMGQIYSFLGLSVGVINHDASYVYDPTHVDDDTVRDEEGGYKVIHEFLRPCTRREAYAADITYGTNNEFGFDYLRDNIEYEMGDVRQREHAFALVDEIDSILIDEARTPLIISAPAGQSENLYALFAGIAKKLKNEEHYIVDEKLKSAALTDAGIEHAQSLLGIENIYTDKGIKYVHHLETAVRAQALYTRDKEYVVREDAVVIVDEFTGRLQPGRRWSDGLHQAIEAKEGVRVQQESRTYASITFQNYFRMYGKLAGMTGTALTSAEEFYTVYGLEVVPVPPHRPVVRDDRNDLIFQTAHGKHEAIVRKVRELHESGQPVLIGTASIERNEVLGELLTKAGIPHQILNAKNHEREGEIIAQAGLRGNVTLATNMAGRGVDIKLGGSLATKEEQDAVKALGGLFVLGTERHEARRIDDQLRGRAGRQGDPGTTQFFVSMEDSLMRVFAADTVKSMMGRLGIPEDQPIENRLITRSLESAQKKIEGFNFDSRKHVLAYDDVLNRQRRSIYDQRRKILEGSHEEIELVLQQVIAQFPDLESATTTKKSELGDAVFYGLVRKLILQVTDMLWVEHLELMDYTRSSVNLRAYGQRDPLMEYRKEGIRLFGEMQEAVLARIAEMMPHLAPAAIQSEEKELRDVQKNARLIGGSETENVPAKAVSKKIYNRNDVVTITNGTETKEIKYKKAEELLAGGAWRIVA